jgi:purine-binding chemotaxis protein CheW
MAGKKQISASAVDRLLFEVELEKVKEVIRYQEMTHVPLAPPAVKGLINLRGQIVTAVDLRHPLDLRDRCEAESSMNAAVRTSDGGVTMMVN